MSYTITENEVIPYEPEALHSFYVCAFEWIDNLLFLQPPERFLGEKSAAYIAIAKERFLDCGWEGDGAVELLWLPSFTFRSREKIPPTGVVLWHVKQIENGVSFLLSPVPLPFSPFSSYKADELSE